MDQFKIVGKKQLRGIVRVSGAKNSALPCLAATLLTPEPITLRNIPCVRDLITMRHLLEGVGVRVTVPEVHTYCVDASAIDSFEANYELVKTMRASVLVLGPLVNRFGRARVSLPGGCAIGQRPIDLHLMALEKMGAQVELRNGVVEVRAERLRGAEIIFDTVTVTGTENVLMAATLAEGATQIVNAAREPEIIDLANLLTKMGAQIEGAGTSVITVRGVTSLHSAEHRIIPDRIETGTLIIAAAITHGELEIADCDPNHSTAVIEQLRLAGVEIERIDADRLRVCVPDHLRAVSVTTEIYPGFPTDMQAQYMALMTQAEGEAEITETIFENRFMHASELQRLGAQLRVSGRAVNIYGPTPLNGGRVMASDLRASASLVLAGLAAEGETLVERVYHIDRGYEKIEEKLRSVGAEIERMKS